MSVFTHALATNNYGPAKFIVAASAANGTHTTLAAAMAAAISGDTIFLRDSVTENITITPGVNIAAWMGASANTPSITGKITMTGAGTSTISGIELITNSDFALAVTGSAASIINLINCYINALNNTAISYTSSSVSSQIYIFDCSGNIATTGIALWTCTSAGNLFVAYSNFTNTGASTTASSFASSGSFTPEYVIFNSPLSLGGTASISGKGLNINTSPTNTVSLAITSTGGGNLYTTSMQSGTASSLTIAGGSALSVDNLTIISSNTNAITGAGSISYGLIVYEGGSHGNNVTTQTAFPTQPSIPVITTTQFDVLVGGAGNTISGVGPGSANQVLQSGGGAANPAYSTATYPATTTINQILYSSAANTIGGLATGNNGVLITSATGVPSFLADGTTGQVLTATTGSPPAWAALPSSGTFVQQTRASNGTATSTTSNYAFGATPTTSNGVQILSVSITPKNSANILLVEYTYWGGAIRNMASGASIAVISALFNGGANAVYSQCDYEYVNTAGSTFEAEQAFSATGRYFVAAGGTSSITFTVRIGPTAGSGATAYFLQDPAGNTLNGTQLGIITVTEYSA
jgi:hypothetical protein